MTWQISPGAWWIRRTKSCYSRPTAPAHHARPWLNPAQPLIKSSLLSPAKIFFFLLKKCKDFLKKNKSDPALAVDCRNHDAIVAALIALPVMGLEFGWPPMICPRWQKTNSPIITTATAGHLCLCSYRLRGRAYRSPSVPSPARPSRSASAALHRFFSSRDVPTVPARVSSKQGFVRCRWLFFQNFAKIFKILRHIESLDACMKY